MAQLQMLYSEWLDQDLVGWIQVNLIREQEKNRLFMNVPKASHIEMSSLHT